LHKLFLDILTFVDATEVNIKLIQAGGNKLIEVIEVNILHPSFYLYTPLFL